MRYSSSLRVSEQPDTLGEVPTEPFHIQLGIHFLAAAIQTSTILIATQDPQWITRGSPPDPHNKTLNRPHDMHTLTTFFL